MLASDTIQTHSFVYLQIISRPTSLICRLVLFICDSTPLLNHNSFQIIQDQEKILFVGDQAEGCVDKEYGK